MTAQRAPLSDERWHFQHGPIDLVLGAKGQLAAVARAHEQAWQRFRGILGELVGELGGLRAAVVGDKCPLHGAVARRMWQACVPYKSSFITPMAAVAGAVAQELIACYDSPGIERAWVNNGGDIALHLTPGEALRIGLYADLAQLDETELGTGIGLDGQFEISSALPVRGVATSGWRGRSFSLGIADSVTVLAGTAAAADAAATVIANAVNLDDPRIVRQAACEVRDDSDLGTLAVTRAVALLEPILVQQALRAGLRRAQALRAAGLIWSAALVCQQQVVTTENRQMAQVPSRIRPRSRRQTGLVFA